MAEVPCTRVIETRLGALRSVAWSPDGSRLAVGDGALGVSVWGLDGRRLWHRVEHAADVADDVDCVVWSPDGRTLASGGDDGSVILWSSADGRVLLHGNRDSGTIAWDLAWSPNGRRLARPGGQGDWNIIQILDPGNGAVLRDLRDATGPVFALAWSPDGRVLASGSGNNSVRLWDPEQDADPRNLEGHQGSVYGIAWSTDGRRLVSGSVDKTLRIWDPTSGRCLHRWEVAKPIYQSLCWSADGRLIAAACGHKGGGQDFGSEIRLWCPDTGREFACLEGHADDVMCTAFAPDGPRLASVSLDGTIRLWDCSALVPRPAAGHSAAARGYLVRQAATVGRRPVFGPGADGPRPEPWVPTGLPRPDDGTAPACLGRFETPAGNLLPSLALAPDGRRLATGSGDGLVRLWDLAGRQPTAGPLWVSAELHEGLHRRGVLDCAFSPDGRRLASAGADGVCRIWDSTTGAPLIALMRLRGHTDEINQAAWSPNGRGLATASGDGTVRLWDPDRGTCLRTLEGHQGIVWTVAWSPDGLRLASGGRDQTVRLWDPESGRALGQLEGHQGMVIGIAFSPDGRRLASALSDFGGEQDIRVWDPLDGRSLHRWPSHERCSDVTQVIWSPDGRMLASAPNHREHSGLDPEAGVRIWDADTGRLRTCLPFPEQDCRRLAWSPDAAFLATSHHDSETHKDIFRLWDTRPLIDPAPDPAAPAHLWPPQDQTGPRPRPVLAADLAPLPDLAAALARLGRCPPLSLLRDLARLLGGPGATVGPAPASEDPLAALAAHPGLLALRALHWPRRAHAGLIALLLRDQPLTDWAPPAQLGPTELGRALGLALAGPPFALDCPPEPPPVLTPLLEQAAARVDDRLLALLTLLGPDAVATEPALPLQLAHRVPLLPPMSTAQRRLLGLRLRLDAGGPVQGSGIGIGSVGITNQGDLRAPLPSQLALPTKIRRARWLRRELLYRARHGQEPPRLRPTVLVLDVSPPVFGPIEGVTRLAAHIAASSLIAAQLPLVLVTLGGRGRVEVLSRRADLVSIWTERTLELAEPRRGLALAQGMARTIRDGQLPPVVLLLSHAWCAAEERDLEAPPGLRALFVQYPRQDIKPPFAVLFTGDLSDRGDPQEFVRFEQEMAKLRRRLNEIAPGIQPFFLAVPGNHDLIRPAAKDPLVKLLKRWGEDPDVAEEFWTDGTCGYRQVIDTAFAGYSGWWEAQAARFPGYRRGLLPGDFSATIEKDGARLGVLGLNTAFLQLGDGDYQGRLALHARQFHAACGGSGPDWARQHQACLLLTHHSPAWLDQDSRGQLDGQIASYGRFAVHLFGHAHESALQQLSEGGTETRRQFQGRSLFGLEHYQEIRDGKLERKVDRSHGYAAGRLEIASADTANLLLWPRRAWKRGGQLGLIAEPDVVLPVDEHTQPIPIKLLQPFRSQGGGPGTAPTAIAVTLDIGVDELTSPLLRRMIDAIQQIGGSVQLRLIQPGSVRLLLVGDAADIRRIEDAYRAGQLATLAGTRVRDIQGVAALPTEAAAANLPLDVLLSQAQARYRAGTQAPDAQPAAARPWDIPRLRRDGILEQLAQVFDQQSAAHALLEHAGFPRQHLAPFGTGTPAQFWESVCREVMNGRMDGGMDTLLAEAADEYPGNGAFRPWRRDQSAPENREYVAPTAAPTQGQGAGLGPGEDRGADWEFLVLGCDDVHLVIDQARTALVALAVGGATVGLNYGVPGLIGLQVCGLDAGQAADLRQTLEGALPAGTQVQLASPGFRDYLYSRLWMTGPDQARFELSNVPASTRVADLAKAGITQYDDAMWPRSKCGRRRPAVVDHDRRDGTSQRLDPDKTLHESGVSDGDTIHVAPQSTARFKKPILPEEDLVRAQLEIRAFADSHPGFAVRAEATRTPTEYLLLFSAPGFAPPPSVGALPVPADHHEVILRLPPKFPLDAPEAFWRTPLFHPNVHPKSGMACLALLAEGYRPGMHFGDLCQMLEDMAAYRSYGLGEVLNADAARWAESPDGQAAIVRRGGRDLSSRIHDR